MINSISGQLRAFASMEKKRSRNVIIAIQLFAIQFIRTDRMCNITFKTNKSSFYGEQNVPTGYLHTFTPANAYHNWRVSSITCISFFYHDKNLINI